MDDLFKLVKTYRLTAALDQRLRLADEIFRRIEPDLRLFVLSATKHPNARDVLQETLKAIAVSLGKFKGDSTPEFWGWCYGIARNKLADHYRMNASDRFIPMAAEELRQLVDASARDAPLSPADKLDLEYAMGLLTVSKPECHELLWKHFVFGFGYAEIAEEKDLTYDAARMKIGRCLDEAKSLVS